MPRRLPRLFSRIQDPLGIETTREGEGWIASIRWREKEFLPSSQFEPWEYSIILGGIQREHALNFARRLHGELMAEPGLEGNSKVRALAQSVLKPELKGYQLHEASGDSAELHGVHKAGTKAKEEMLLELKVAKSLKLPVEFAYVGLHDFLENFHVKRAEVREIMDWGFRGEHERGFRSYKFEGVKWLAINGTRSALMPTHMLKISLVKNSSDYGGTILETHYGVLGKEGELLMEEKTSPREPA